MADINLLISKKGNSETTIKVRKIVKKVTTLVLVGYVSIAVVTLGWFAYSAGKKERVNKELIQLSSQVAARAKEEVLIRRADERAKLVNKFLRDRPQGAKMAQVLVSSGAQVVGWDFGENGKQTVKTAAKSAEEIDALAKNLTNSYDLVRIDSIIFKPVEGWLGTITLGGFKL